MMYNPAHTQTETSQTRLLLTGLSTMSDDQVVSLAKSWLQAPALEGEQGVGDVAYIEAERAYHLTAEADTITFTLGGSASQPIFNPAFVIRGWDSTAEAVLTINGEPVENVQQGISRDPSGAERSC